MLRWASCRGVPERKQDLGGGTSELRLRYVTKGGHNHVERKLIDLALVDQKREHLGLGMALTGASILSCRGISLVFLRHPRKLEALSSIVT